MPALRTLRSSPAALALAFVASCGTVPADELGINDGPTYRAFEEAAANEGVPLDLLLAIGWVESRWTHVVPDAEAGEGPDALAPDGLPMGGHGHGAYGMLQLRDGDTLDLAAQLTELDLATLKTDAAANVRGGAAVLRRYADEAYEGLDVDNLDLASWRDVVARWTGISEPSLALEAADEVFAVLRSGAGRTLPDGEVIELFAQPELSVDGDVVVDGGTENPDARYTSGGQGLGMAGVRFDPASGSNYTAGRGGNRIRYVVIHTTQGSWSGAVSWFKNPRARVSAHYVIRSRDGERVQMVDEVNTAWHAGNWSYNQQSVGIEHEGFVSDPEWYTDAMYRSSAALTCDLVRRHSIPVDRQHIIGHVEVPGASHTDPGRHWNWTYYLSLVRECTGGGSVGGTPADDGNSNGGTTATPPRAGQGTLQGVIYADGNTSNRIAGATVRLSNGLTATTASNGHYSFRVNAGSYTVTASANGYRSASVARNVAANASVWGSINLVRGAEPTGRLSGVVFESGNTANRIAGASVGVAGRSATTDANGRWSLDVPVGRAEIDVSANGFRSAQFYADVRAGQTFTVNAGLVRREAQGDLVGIIHELRDFNRKIGGARVVAVQGTTSLSTTADANGLYEFKGVASGSWRVTASAPGYAAGSRIGNVVAAQRNWTSIGLGKAGSTGTGILIGVVFEAPNTARRIANATVTLSNGLTVKTDGNGVYRVSAAGTVTAIASAAGFSPRSVTRTVPEGREIWGSIGLVRGASDTGTAGTATTCSPTAPRQTRRLDAVVVLRSPIDDATVGARPTFEFDGIGDGQAKYVVVLAREGDADRTFEVPAGDTHAVQASFDLPSGRWAWGAYPVWADCQHGEVLYWGFFTVR